jgi:ADP-ribose pyrophosphatase
LALQRHPDVRVTSSRTVYEGRIFDIVRESLILPSGLEQDLSIVDHPGAVAVAAVDARGEILLVRQYRHACGDWLLEVPAGRVEVGEDRLAAAMRELEEETGHRARHWEVLREFFAAPGFCSELLTLYLARDLVPVAHGALEKDRDEELEIVRRSPESLLASDIRDAKTLIAGALLAGSVLARRG